MVRITVAQLEPKLGDKEANLRLIEKALTEALGDLVIFPELFLTGYMCRDDLFGLAESLDGPSISKLKGLSKGTGKHIIIGMPESHPERRGVIHNSAVLLYPDEEVGVYRKIQPANFGPFEEKRYFAPGRSLPVFDTPFGTISMLICFDLFFPEISRVYALKGADIIVCISASPSATGEYFEKVLVARAIENALFAVYSNLVGSEMNLVFWSNANACVLDLHHYFAFFLSA